jgi:hypothetical protein
LVFSLALNGCEPSKAPEEEPQTFLVNDRSVNVNYQAIPTFVKVEFAARFKGIKSRILKEKFY